MRLAPWWVLVLEAAEAWGVPPWVIAEDESPDAVLWMERYNALRTARHKASQPKRNR